ncbi:hypothetical protein FM019_09000 [Aliiglaciecola sp. M165]|nr:hypothetical protein FM019_09000 [Aliiglaciecola sp. M165]
MTKKKEMSEAQIQTLLEQYKIYVGTAEAVSHRRQVANSFFITLNATILTLLSFVHKQFETGLVTLFIMSFIGIIVSLLWYRLICSYRDLNTAKFKVIHELEQFFPAQPFDVEWVILRKQKPKGEYLVFTTLERLIPLVFLVLHIAVVIVVGLRI